ASVVRDHAVPHAEAGLLTGFAKVALDRGDHARAARLLAVVRASAGAGRIVFRTHFDWLIYAHTREVLRSVLDAGDAHTYQADAATITLAQAIDAELARCRQA
ncbi:MAG TPA: hypothetical protein VFA70_11730, partial [Dehalococcoidia bacterium]|nr:hypothetical protein [Dehalococcoidia bacterium]